MTARTDCAAASEESVISWYGAELLKYPELPPSHAARIEAVMAAMSYERRPDGTWGKVAVPQPERTGVRLCPSQRRFADEMRAA